MHKSAFKHYSSERRLRQIVQKEISRSKFLNESSLYKAVGRNSPFTKRNIVSMLESGFFTLQEEAALKVLIKNENFRRLNEASVGRIDETVLNIVGGRNRIFTEAYANILNGVRRDVIGNSIALDEGVVSDLYDKAKAALLGGWSKLKQIWNNFSKLVKQICGVIVDGLKKLWEGAKKKGEDAAREWKSKSKQKEQESLDPEAPAFKKEVDHTSSIYSFWHSKIYESWILGSTWIEKTVQGSISPGDFDDSSVSESVNAFMFNFSNAHFLNEIHENFRKKFLYEAGHEEDKHGGKEGAHGEHPSLIELESATQSPVGKKIISITLKIIEAVFAPTVAATKWLANLGSGKILNGVSEITAETGGPAHVPYVLLSHLIGEVVATLSEGLVKAHLAPSLMAHAFHGSLLAVLGAAAAPLTGVIAGVQGLLFCYAVIVCVMNIVDMIKGGEYSKAISGTEDFNRKMASGHYTREKAHEGRRYRRRFIG